MFDAYERAPQNTSVVRKLQSLFQRFQIHNFSKHLSIRIWYH